MNEKNSYEKFQQIVSVILGGLLGYLILMPVSVGQANYPIYLFSGIIMGALIGYRRRKSKFFLYFCMFGIITIAVIISLNNKSYFLN